MLGQNSNVAVQTGQVATAKRCLVLVQIVLRLGAIAQANPLPILALTAFVRSVGQMKPSRVIGLT